MLIMSALLAACSEGDDAAPPAPTLSTEAAFGKDLFTLHCAACHATSPDTVIVGPSMIGVRDRAEERVVGQSAEQYLLNSILRPGEYLVEGYEDNMPPDLAKRLSGEEMDAILAYIVTLD
jgi:mono/diheme cytochrome c family protein